MSDVELLFCGHHFREHEDRLREVCTEVHDHRDLINKAASISAST